MLKLSYFGGEEGGRAGKRRQRDPELWCWVLSFLAFHIYAGRDKGEGAGE